MKKMFQFYFLALLAIPVFVNAQTFIDPGLNVEANVFAYKLSAVPTIDGNDTEWQSIPWQNLNFQDRDYNDDGLIDPLPDRNDFQARFKAGWVEGTSKLFLLVDLRDDIIHNPEEVNWYNKDGLEIRVDPFNSEAAGEPSSSGTAFNLGFTVGQVLSSGLEGPETTYEAAWDVDKSSFPVKSVLETAIDLPTSVTLVADYEMGFLLYCSDNDGNQDDSPNDKDAVLAPWPQRIYGATNTPIGIDGSWENIYYWGNIICIAQTVIDVFDGSSIQVAVDGANPGDIIKVAAGDFEENIVIRTPYLYLEGTMNETDTTKLSPSANGLPVIEIAGGDSAYGVTITGFKFNGEYDNAGTPAYSALAIQTGSALTRISNNYITFFEFAVQQFANDAEKNAFAGIYEDNYCTMNNGGIDIFSPSSQVRYNTFWEQTSGYAIDTKGLLANSTIDIAYNKVLNQHGQCGIGYGGSGVFTIHHNYLVRGYDLWSTLNTSGDDGTENQDAGGSTDYLYNNTIVGWKSDGMQMGNGSSNFKVRNNLIAYQGAKDYDVRTVGSTDIDYGLSFSNGIQNSITIGGGPSSFDSVAINLGAQNIIIANPEFTDELGDDYTILETSPAVDAGLKDPFGFKTMYFGNAPDIGAYETGEVSVSVEDELNTEIPSRYKLDQNYPNPFNPSTKIAFSIPQGGLVTLKVYNLIGQEVASLVTGNLAAGEHEIEFNAGNLVSGIYFYTLNANDFSVTKKMVLIK